MQETLLILKTFTTSKLQQNQQIHNITYVYREKHVKTHPLSSSSQFLPPQASLAQAHSSSLKFTRKLFEDALSSPLLTQRTKEQETNIWLSIWTLALKFVQTNLH
jgi:hypothetical protein